MMIAWLGVLDIDQEGVWVLVFDDAGQNYSTRVGAAILEEQMFEIGDAFSATILADGTRTYERCPADWKTAEPARAKVFENRKGWLPLTKVMWRHVHGEVNR